MILKIHAKIDIDLNLFICVSAYFRWMATRLKTELTTKLKFQNIVTLLQDSLEANFKLIADSIDQHEGIINNFTELHNQTHNNIATVQQNIHHHSKQQSQLKDEIINIKRTLEKLGVNLAEQDSNAKNQKENKKVGINNPETDLLDQFNKFKAQIRSSYEQGKSQQNDLLEKYKSLEKQISQVKSELKKNSGSQNKMSPEQLSKLAKQHSSGLKSAEKQITTMKEELAKLNKIAHNNQINGKGLKQSLQNLQKSFDQFIGEEYQNLKNEIEKSNENFQQELQNLRKSLDEQDRLRTRLAQEVYQMDKKDSSQDHQKQLDLQIAYDNIKRLQKDYADLDRKFKEYTANNSNKNDASSNFNQTSTINDTFESPNKNYNKNTNVNFEEMNTIDFESLKDEVSERLSDFRNDLLRSLKKLENKTSEEDENLRKKIVQLEEKLLKIELLLSEKADLASVKKMFSYLENKLTYLFNYVLGDSNNEEDARIAKKQWICLSCDKKLDNYTGKVGNHLVTSQLRGKLMQQQTVGGGMTLKPSKSKFDLPNVHKMNQQSEKNLKSRR